MIKKVLAASLVGLFFSTAAHAAYPTTPVTIVSPFSAGQTGDYIARVIAKELTTRLGQTFIVENRPGAGGRVGTGFVARAKNDGYTLLLSSSGPFAIAPSLYPKTTTYNPLKDFAPIAEVASTPQILAVSNQSGIKSVPELVKLARSSDISYASAGNGSTQHLAMELLKKELSMPMVHIAFKGSSEAKQQVMSGAIPVTSDSLPAILAQIKSGQMKAIAIIEPERSPYLPQVATLAELGYPKFSATAFFGLVAPKGTPKNVVDTLNKQVEEILKMPAVQEKYKELALTLPKSQTPEQFGAYLASEIGRWKKIVADAQVVLEE
jgi:tripartite-type tricarboxylate transporter receptor subunit TctC